MLRTCSIECAARIRELKERGCHVLFFLSGGKDSVASLDILLRLLGPKYIDYIVYIRVAGNTHPISDYVVEKIFDIYATHYGIDDDKFIVIEGWYKCSRHGKLEDFFECLIKHAGFPFYGNRWCTFQFKLVPLQHWVHNFLKCSMRRTVHVVGVKRTDSPVRQCWYTTVCRVDTKVEPRYLATPVLDYTSQEVRQWIRHNAPPEVAQIVDEMYSEWGGVPNCVFCPFHTIEKIVKIVRHLDENWRRRILEAINSVQADTKFNREVKQKWTRYLKNPLPDITKC